MYGGGVARRGGAGRDGTGRDGTAAGRVGMAGAGRYGGRPVACCYSGGSVGVPLLGDGYPWYVA